MKKVSDQMVNRIHKVAQISEVLNDILFRDRPILKDFDIENIEIDNEKQVFRNYKTGDGGDVVILLMKAYNFQYSDALLWLQNKYDLKEGIPSNQEIEISGHELYLYFLDLYKHRNIQIDECSFKDGFNFGADYCKSFFEKMV
jgi:hypothetical protein